MSHITKLTQQSDLPQQAQLLDLFQCLNAGAIGVDRFELCDPSDPNSTKKTAVAGAILQILGNGTQA